ncbi:alpha/beta hydrolase [Blastopirellula sp. JC732]|uniref:Alpha/beta hydrolase n=1 Tax=Blastopirellula sediminis TaxID=2894196 RepID=A0A9X1MPV0_9BACT|nr:alpha/beta fold hydrolase [Blastopirellula sediminis]MCC9606445.1 alpha/beta hydrolase [Blastopirellula sediminis]MCC9630257.1 alpha/beta hydrolase [Blastopirellula sediminis]
MQGERIPIGEVTLNVVIRGEGEPILLAHGFPLDHSMWEAQINVLAAEGYQVIAPDLRGFGGSDPAKDKTTMAQFADDLSRLLAKLNVTKPVTFCGLSMGGYIAWQFFLRHRTRLARLILCDTRANDDDEKVARGRLVMAAEVERFGLEKVPGTMLPKLIAPITLEKNEAVVAALQAAILRQDPAGVAAAQRGMAERQNVVELLSTIDVPTLVICGEVDAITPPDVMRAIADAIPCAEYVEIAGAGHMAPMERAVETNTAILNFLKSN